MHTPRYASGEGAKLTVSNQRIRVSLLFEKATEYTFLTKRQPGTT
jgi:hypothetical protein